MSSVTRPPWALIIRHRSASRSLSGMFAVMGWALRSGYPRPPRESSEQPKPGNETKFTEPEVAFHFMTKT